MHPIPYWLAVFFLSMIFVYAIGLVNGLVMVITVGEVGSGFVPICVLIMYLLSQYVLYLCDKYGIDADYLSQL